MGKLFAVVWANEEAPILGTHVWLLPAVIRPTIVNAYHAAFNDLVRNLEGV